MIQGPAPAKILCDRVSHVYRTVSGTNVVALEDVSFAVRPHELISLVGPSGCGKSTLLNILAGFIRPSSGTVLKDGAPVRKPGQDRAVVFQGDAVFPWYTVAQNLAYGPKRSGVSSSTQRDIVRRYLSLVGLEGYGDRYPKELSGGMKKRVDLARAYAADPDVLLMDEPFGALDALTKEEMQLALSTINDVDHKTIVFVTHDIEEALFLSDRVVVFAGQPGHVVRVLVVPFGRPRSPLLKREHEFQELRHSVELQLHEDAP